jgi:tRNA pseudouridine55 synthase
VAERPVALSTAQIEAALDAFRGPIEQAPPVYSAIKRQGAPLYRQARAGRAVRPEPRPVTVYELELLGWRPPDLRVQVHCSSGTYIRSIAHDLGRALGCGGHVAALRRTRLGPFAVEQAHALADLDREALAESVLPPDAAVAHLGAVTLGPEEARALVNGRSAPAQPGWSDGQLARVYDSAGRFLGLAFLDQGLWRPRKLFPRPEAD